MKLRKLSFSDRWMFNRVMCQEEICKRVIKAAFGIDVARIEYLNAEQCYEPSAENRGVRMDVVAKSTGKTFDLEMQVSPERCLGKRMRFYQAGLDSGELKKGSPFSELPESYILFLCCFDPFGLRLPVYTIERVCIESPNLVVGDDAHWMALNAEAWADAANSELEDLLNYVGTGKATGSLSHDIDELVETYNEDRKWVGRVCTLEDQIEWDLRDARTEARARGWQEGMAEGRKAGMAEGRKAGMAEGRKEGMVEGRKEGMAEGRKEGMAEGRKAGEERFGKLVSLLVSKNRGEDIERAATDSSFRAQLFAEFNL